jgi:antirestriction protein ArdC
MTMTTTTGPKKDVYQIITDRILEKLEAGKIPWERPWRLYGGGDGEIGFYQNGITKRKYGGVNILLLAGCGFESPDFFSWKQVEKLGGTIKDEHKKNGEMVVFWKITRYKAQNGDDADNDGDSGNDVDGNDSGKDEWKKGVILRYYRVWNREQCDGLPEKVSKAIEDEEKKKDEELDIMPEENAERILAEYASDGPTVQEGFAQACYIPAKDHVNMPKRTSFKTNEAWYATLFHELAHSTGHHKRLNRIEMKTYCGDNRAREELCAEIAASFLCGVAGIERPIIENTVAYVQSWSRQLRDDKKCVVLAAQAAQKAANWILGKRDQIFGFGGGKEVVA